MYRLSASARFSAPFSCSARRASSSDQKDSRSPEELPLTFDSSGAFRYRSSPKLSFANQFSAGSCTVTLASSPEGLTWVAMVTGSAGLLPASRLPTGGRKEASAARYTSRGRSVTIEATPQYPSRFRKVTVT